MSKFFSPTGDFAEPSFVRGAWRDLEALDQNLGQPIYFDNGGRLTRPTKSFLLDNWYALTVDELEPLPIIGEFEPLPQTLMLVSAELRNVLENVASDDLEYVGPAKVWDAKRSAPMAGGPYYYASIVTRLDGWDPKNTDLQRLIRADGTPFEIVQLSGRKRFNLQAEAIGSAQIWRDARTLTPVIAASVREALEAAGVTALRYVPISVT